MTIDDIKAALIVAKARSFVGTKYQRGGISQAGIDCSGLVMVSYAAAGLVVPHKARKIRLTVGREVSLASLAPGDILYVDTGADVDHVGIYDGHGNAIHATSVYNKAVIQPISEWRAKGWLDGARRVLAVTSASASLIMPTVTLPVASRPNSVPQGTVVTYVPVPGDEEEGGWQTIAAVVGALGLAAGAAWTLHRLLARR